MALMRHAAPLAMLPFVWACTASTPEAPDCVDLTGPEIRTLFAGVIDRAEVQDGARGRARNHWCRDGRFTSTWQLPGGRDGELEGRWWVEGDLRCVSVDAGLPDDGSLRRCSPIQRCGGRIGTVNEAGGRHGWHVLEPAPCPAVDGTPPAE